MKWVSVYAETVESPKFRRLYKTLRCSAAEALGILCFIWIYGQDNAEKTGKLVYIDEEDLSRYISYRNEKSSLTPGEVIQTLISTGWLDKNGDDIYIHDWDMWQEQWYKAKERRQNDMIRKRESRRRLSALPETRMEHSESTKDSPEEVPMDSPQDSPKTSGEISGEKGEKLSYSKDFEDFWEIYPRKMGKGEAYKKYKARRNDGFSEQELLEAAKEYAKICKKQGTEKQYIKHPKTFLSDNMPFLDYIPKKNNTMVDSQPLGDFNPFQMWGGE